MVFCFISFQMMVWECKLSENIDYSISVYHHCHSFHTHFSFSSSLTKFSFVFCLVKFDWSLHVWILIFIFWCVLLICVFSKFEYLLLVQWTKEKVKSSRWYYLVRLLMSIITRYCFYCFYVLICKLKEVVSVSIQQILHA